jgi:hypothetical protein
VRQRHPAAAQAGDQDQRPLQDIAGLAHGIDPARIDADDQQDAGQHQGAGKAQQQGPMGARRFQKADQDQAERHELGEVAVAADRHQQRRGTLSRLRSFAQAGA